MQAAVTVSQNSKFRASNNVAKSREPKTAHTIRNSKMKRITSTAKRLMAFSTTSKIANANTTASPLCRQRCDHNASGWRVERPIAAPPRSTPRAKSLHPGLASHFVVQSWTATTTMMRIQQSPRRVGMRRRGAGLDSEFGPRGECGSSLRLLLFINQHDAHYVAKNNP